MSVDDMRMPSSDIVSQSEFEFVSCSTPGCNNSSAFSQYNATTLRAGFGTCTNHTNIDAIGNRINDLVMHHDTIFIFYDIAVTPTMEIDQLSAYASTGQSFTTIIKTSVRRNNSPILSKFTPMIYMILATEPRIAFENFVLWVNMIMHENSSGNASPSNVVMVAHNGMCHDHVILFKSMMMWGIQPPKWRLSDSLPIFKLVMRPDPDQSSSLSTLASEYVPWYFHRPHDALSDSTALRHVVICAVPNWKLACYTFSCPFDYFIKSVGLNTYRVRNPLPFPNVLQYSNSSMDPTMSAFAQRPGAMTKDSMRPSQALRTKARDLFMDTISDLGKDAIDMIGTTLFVHAGEKLDMSEIMITALMRYMNEKGDEAPSSESMQGMLRIMQPYTKEGMIELGHQVRTMNLDDDPQSVVIFFDEDLLME